jgi:hypothetical protein
MTWVNLRTMHLPDDCTDIDWSPVPPHSLPTNVLMAGEGPGRRSKATRGISAQFRTEQRKGNHGRRRSNDNWAF